MFLRLKGFSLIELIIVIIIVGILATLGFTSYTAIMEKAREAEAMNAFKALHTAVTGIYLESGFGAINGDALLAAYNLPTGCSPNFYFSYGISSISGSGQYAVFFTARRCTAGGKPPQGKERCIVFSGCLSPTTKTKIQTYDGASCSASTGVCN